MKVRKANRVLTVDEADKTFYLSEGYDVVELNNESKEYDIVEPATGGKTYTIAEYNEVVAEREAIKAERDAIKAELAEYLSSQVAGFDRKTAIETLKEKGVEFKGNASNDELKKLLEDSA